MKGSFIGRSFGLGLLIVLLGDIIGLTIYYLGHPDQWTHMSRTQVLLQIVISVTIATLMAFLHGAHKHTRKSVQQIDHQMIVFFGSILITLMMTSKFH